jgi:hypothetical protein
VSGNGRKRGVPSIEGWIARAGAIAAAIVSIAAAVAVLWPDADPPTQGPARLAATFDEPLVDLNASPREFKARQLRAASTRLTYVAYVQASEGSGDAEGSGEAVTPPQGDDTPPPPDDSQADDGSTAPDATDEDGLADDEDPDGETSTDAEIPTDAEAEAYEADLGLQDDLPADELETAGEISGQLPPQLLPPGCRYGLADEHLVIDCDGENPFTELTQGLAFIRGRDLTAPAADKPAAGESMSDEPAPGRPIIAILRGTRTRPVPASAGLSDRAEGLETEPVGVIVSVALTLVGLEDEDVSVYWSLYHARDGGRVPRAWLVNRRASTAHADAGTDRRASTFWVPLPKLRGPFYVRLSAVAEDGTVLDYQNTQPFE